MRQVRPKKLFRRDLKKLQNSGQFERRELDQVLELLLNDSPLPKHLGDHPLSGEWKPLNARDCHIRPDLILIYAKTPTELRLYRIGSHSEIFG